MDTNTTAMAGGSSARERRVTVVTGAGTGIGRATARTFAGEGAHVLAVGRRPGPLRETADGDDRVRPLPADVTCEEGRTRIADAVRERGPAQPEERRPGLDGAFGQEGAPVTANGGAVTGAVRVRPKPEVPDRLPVVGRLRCGGM